MKASLSFLIFALFSTSIVLGQEKLPDIFPPAPTASELGKFGTYPVDLASGMPRIEIPLYTVTSGDISIPITLKYHASGIKVNQMPSWVGLGWALDTGGLISLETRDTPDELEPDPYTIPNVTALTTTIGANPYDFQVPDVLNAEKYSWVKDAYHISLPTVSGTFFLDSDNDGEVTTKFPPDQFKIYRHKNVNVHNPYFYKVIDKQGIQYEFVDYEQSQLNKPTSGGGTHIHNTPYKSAWLLNKVINPKGDSLTYSYGTQYTGISFGESHSQKYTYTNGRGEGNELFETSQMFGWTSNSSTSLTFANKLQEISFPNGRVRFITTSNTQYAGGDGVNGVYLDRIIIEEGNTISGYTEIKTIHFEYSITGDPTNYLGVDKYRFKLDRVYETYGTIDEKEVVSLEYSLEQLPHLRSFSMDYFGNFNGKTNPNLIPKRDIIVENLGTFYQIGAADRSIDLTKMQAGMLTKIKYPTKGYTTFTYEPNSFYGKNIFLKDETVTETLDIIGTGNGSNPPSPIEDPDIQTEVFSFNLNEATTLILTGTLTCIGCDITNAKYAYANIRVLNNGSEVLNFTGYSNDYLSTPTLSVGSVTVVLEVYGSLVEAHIQAAYFNKLGNLPDENVQGFGLRVKNITNRDSNNAFINQKEYSYNMPGTTNSSGKLVNNHFMYDRFTDFDYFDLGSCYPPNFEDTRTRTYTYGSSSRSGIENNNITYEHVRELDKDSLGNTKGKTDYKYTITPNIITDNNGGGSIRVNLNHERGQLLIKEVYNEQNKILTKEAHLYTQNLNVSNTRTDFKMYSHGSSNLLDPPGCITPPFTLSDTKELLESSIPIYWYKKDKTDLTQYFYDASGTLVNELLTSTNYIYNSLNQEVQKTTMTNSKGIVLETSYKYAQDLNDTPLITSNEISIPLETKILEDSQIVSHSKTQYAAFNGLHLPQKVFSKKGALVDVNNSDDCKYTFDSYENGKITQYHIENGATTSIIWGYDEAHPVAKIENATYSAVTATLTSTELTAIKDGSYNQSTMRTTLDKIRTGLPDAMVTTYTYDPLIGVTSVTDPKGYTTYYEYDAFNRLEFVKDAEGNILSANKYHYKNLQIPQQ
ncbi:RHS repeat domain-containing protein [Flavivirga abyssicola]|uniref:RHS repeat protein n=1 Tax=Flavivirga abyssicola TaxID=3063533 RepID=UPI0026DED7C6|nr:RHS repeat domain-containing protein [Flavivirga sp. MEBiC07777]WVK12511.1 RHS repeat domain-containing protein [Flavivirga sp. MEBiC07777]